LTQKACTVLFGPQLASVIGNVIPSLLRIHRKILKIKEYFSLSEASEGGGGKTNVQGYL